MTEENMAELQSLIDKAEREGKWLFCRYQALWFSPTQLRDQIKNGCFRWGVVNWELRHHKERITELEEAVKEATADLRHACEEL